MIWPVNVLSVICWPVFSIGAVCRYFGFHMWVALLTVVNSKIILLAKRCQFHIQGRRLTCLMGYLHSFFLPHYFRKRKCFDLVEQVFGEPRSMCMMHNLFKLTVASESLRTSIEGCIHLKKDSYLCQGCFFLQWTNQRVNTCYNCKNCFNLYPFPHVLIKYVPMYSIYINASGFKHLVEPFHSYNIF